MYLHIINSYKLLKEQNNGMGSTVPHTNLPYRQEVVDVHKNRETESISADKWS